MRSPGLGASPSAQAVSNAQTHCILSLKQVIAFVLTLSGAPTNVRVALGRA